MKNIQDWKCAIYYRIYTWMACAIIGLDYIFSLTSMQRMLFITKKINSGIFKTTSPIDTYAN